MTLLPKSMVQMAKHCLRQSWTLKAQFKRLIMWQIFELVVKYTDIRDWMHKKAAWAKCITFWREIYKLWLGILKSTCLFLSLDLISKFIIFNSGFIIIKPELNNNCKSNDHFRAFSVCLQIQRSHTVEASFSQRCFDWPPGKWWNWVLSPAANGRGL